MLRRIRIPFVIDVAIVKSEADMARLNNEPALRRGLTGAGPWLHRLLERRIRNTFSVGSGRMAPVFEPRDHPGRLAAQQKAEADLTDKAGMPHPFDRDAIEDLSRYVTRGKPERPIGVTVQHIVGRLFDRSYTATPESYKAARVVNAVLSACPVDMVRVFWWKLTGRLAASRALLWQLAHDDPVVIHSTVIAMHSIVDSLTRMRATMRADGPWQATPAQVVAAALAPPSRLLRQCVRETTLDKPLRPGALVFFRLAQMHAGTESNDLALAGREWNQCPAHAIVPRLLEDVWKAAVAAMAARRYRARRSLTSLFIFAPAIRLFAWVNRLVPWYRLPVWLGFLNLAVLRAQLRERNLYDTSLLPSKAGDLPEASPDVLRWRTADGSFNDLQNPNMGRAGTRFGRNVPLGYTYPDADSLLDPNPRMVSRVLLTRHEFIPAPSLNVLAAAWLQFQVHDWFSHGPSDTDHQIVVPIEPGDPWPGDKPMRIGRTAPDRTRGDDPPTGPPTYINPVTHWWDASQLYGSNRDTQRTVRSGHHGKLALDESGLIPLGADGVEITGVRDNWWLGLTLFHHLFTYEHNSICDRLRAEYPDWNDEHLFQTARLVNAALIAKIHDIEWVPTALAHPTAQRGLYASWWGLLGKWVATHVGRFHACDLLGGIPGSATNHHGAPYALTEEFVSVYRMHAFMLPEEVDLHKIASRTRVGAAKFETLLGRGAREMAKTLDDMTDLLYSFGRGMPGKLTIGNYSKAMQQFRPAGGPMVDLGAVDILRDRERGVPRYNRFRELLHLAPVRTFEELNPEWADRLRDVYGTVDRIDLMVGMFAEIPISGFGFSETTFRLFLLMNSRRLKSDRFYTADYRPAIYTQVGLDWIDANDLRRVLLRHFPGLEPVLANVSRPFAPWPA